MSVFLEMSKGYVNENKYEYKIELINQKYLKDSIVREYSSNFDIGECWGYNQFVPLEELENDFLTDEGSLVFHVCVRNPSYRSLVRDQNNYIDKLENKLQEESEKKKNLKKVKSKKKMNELEEEVKLRKESIEKLLM